MLGKKRMDVMFINITIKLETIEQTVTHPCKPESAENRNRQESHPDKAAQNDHLQPSYKYIPPLTSSEKIQSVTMSC
jgi:hypothetical protein